MTCGNINRVVTLENFITKEEQTSLLTYCKAPFAPWKQTLPNDPWNERTIPHTQARSDIKPILREIRQRIISAVTDEFNLTDPLFADSLALVRWRFGDQQLPHADAENPDGSPHPFPWRAYGAIAYLNDDFSGGQLTFPDLKLTPKTSPGTLAFFPGTADYLHGVTRVTGGVRYTLATFLTYDASQQDMLE